MCARGTRRLSCEPTPVADPKTPGDLFFESYCALNGYDAQHGAKAAPNRKRIPIAIRTRVPMSLVTAKTVAVQSSGLRRSGSEEGGERTAGVVGGEQVAEVGEQGPVL